MQWDGTVTLGAVINAVVLLGAVLASYIRISDRLARIEEQVKPMWAIFAERRAPHVRKDADD